MPRFNLAQYCALCEHLLRDVGSIALWMPYSGREPVAYSLCGKCSLQMAMASPEKQQKLAAHIEYNVMNSLPKREGIK